MNQRISETTLCFSRVLDTQQLEARVRCRLGGRVRGFQVLDREHGLVLRGYAQTYYAKQLAQHAIMEATVQPIVANEIEVY